MTIQRTPSSLKKLIAVNIIWNLCSVIGIIFFSGNFEYGTSDFKFRQLLFAIQAIIWVRIGFVSYQIGELISFKRRDNIRGVSNILGTFCIIILSVILCIDPTLITNTEILGYHPFAEHPIFCVFSIIYILFVLPVLIAAIYYLLRNALHAVDQSLAQTETYMAGTYGFFVIVAFTFDIIIPIASNFGSWTGSFHFLIWHQFSTLMLTVICGQFYTSANYKDRSALWFLRKLNSKMEDGIFYFDNDGKIEYANQGAVKLLGYSSAESILGKSIRTIFTPNLDIFRELVYNDIPVDINGETHTLKIHFFKARQTLTTVMNIAYFSDISKTQLLQQNIKTLNEQYVEYTHDLVRYQTRLEREANFKVERENLLNTLINNLPFRVWYKNELGVYQKQNQQDLVFQGSLEGSKDEPDRVNALEKNARENGEGGAYTSYIDRNGIEISSDDAIKLTKNGEPVQIFENMYIPIIQERPPCKTLCIMIDVTEQRRLEQERNMLREQKFIHSRLEELGTMCGAFAHDYNNILGSQIGFCQLAQEMLPQDNPAYMFISEALKAALRGKTSLEELLNAIRGNARSATPAIVFSPYMIIEDVVKKIGLTIPPNITIHSEGLDQSLKIRGIVASLDRIISNLANNAIFAMKENGGHLTFALQKCVLESQLVTPYAPPIPAGEYAKIDIIDTGTGMDSGTLERIFAPFFTTKAPGEGLGLGLSSALRLLNDGKAYFTVQTTVGEGTAFNLYWPLETETKED